MRQIIEGFIRMDADQILAAGAIASLIGIGVLAYASWLKAQ